MEIVLSSFILGISFGSILFLLGTGLSLTMGLMKIVNLAHGAIYMVGAYVGLTVARQTQNFLLGVLAGGLASGLLGMLMEVGFLRRLYKRNMDQALLTIGFVYVLVNIVQWIWGPLPQSYFVPEVWSQLHSHCQLENPRISSGDHRCRHCRRSGFVVLPGKNTDRRNYSRRNG